MILNVEKIHAIKFQKLVMMPFDNTKIHHVALWNFLSDFIIIIQTLILAIHYDHSF
jgi:hypothetical protein